MPITGGWVKRPRCISNSEIAIAPPSYRELWELITREANYKDANYRGYSILRGQLFRSYEQLAESLHWYVGKRKEIYKLYVIKNAMRYFRKKGMVTTMKKPRGVIITICNYDYYQNAENYENTNENTKENSHNTLIKHQTNSIYNKNKKNKIKNKEYMSDLVESDITDNYLKIAYEFWSLFKENLKNSKEALDTLENAICSNWREPIRMLIEKDKKSKEDLLLVYSFLEVDEFWKDKIFSTSKFRKWNDQGMTYFDFFLLKKKNLDSASKLPGKEVFLPLLEKHFKNPTDYFISKFNDYIIMIHEQFSQLIKGKLLEIEINKLAKSSTKDPATAVNMLNKAIKYKKKFDEISLV